jgi:hypothetical protein
MAPLSTDTARAVLALAAALSLSTSAVSQAPPLPAQQQAAAVQQQEQSPLGPANQFRTGPFGEARPNIGANPVPLIRRSTDCPLGYVALRDKERVAHLTVCIVKPPNQLTLSNVAGPGAGLPGQMSSMPPILERTAVNQCLGRPQGSYACGRSGSECCGPKQDNMCFAGSFACYPAGVGTGPKSACCISK